MNTVEIVLVYGAFVLLSGSVAAVAAIKSYRSIRVERQIQAILGSEWTLNEAR
jgi:hypothetical protein